MRTIKIGYMFCLFFASFSIFAMVDNMNDNVGSQTLTLYDLSTQTLSFQTVNKIDAVNEKATDKVTVVHFKQIQFGDNFSSSALYHYGRFMAETGISHENTDLYENTRFYLQSSLVVFNWQRFNVALSARIDNVDHFSGYSTLFDPQNIYKDQNNLASTTLGLIGSYSFSKKWKVTGAITSTSVLSNLPENAQLPNLNMSNNSEKMAIIGTSYSF